jgi:hypothetical protein
VFHLTLLYQILLDQLCLLVWVRRVSKHSDVEEIDTKESHKHNTLVGTSVAYITSLSPLLWSCNTIIVVPFSLWAQTMAPIVHQIDSDPDTVIILRNPCPRHLLCKPVVLKSKEPVPNVQLGADKAEPSSDGSTPLSVVAAESVAPEPEGIHYRVSSRHLMLASPMFERILTRDGFAEL